MRLAFIELATGKLSKVGPLVMTFQMVGDTPGEDIVERQRSSPGETVSVSVILARQVHDGEVKMLLVLSQCP